MIRAAAITRASDYLAEARNFIRSWCSDLRGRRDYRNLNDGEALGSIIHDAAASQTQAVAHAYTAEQADLEAARLMRAAQHPASPGGRDITPTEAAPIFRQVTNSAKHDRQACELLT